MPLFVAFAAAIVLSVVLLATGNTIVPPRVWEGFWNMPPGMGAFLGSFFGLLGVAGSAWLGFHGLVRSREREAELTRERDAELHDLARFTEATSLRSQISALMKEVVACRLALDDGRRNAAAERRTVTAEDVELEVLVPAALAHEPTLARAAIVGPAVTLAVVPLLRCHKDLRGRFDRGFFMLTEVRLDELASNLETLLRYCRDPILELTQCINTVSKRHDWEIPVPRDAKAPVPAGAGAWIYELPQLDGAEGRAPDSGV